MHLAASVVNRPARPTRRDRGTNNQDMCCECRGQAALSPSVRGAVSPVPPVTLLTTPVAGLLLLCSVVKLMVKGAGGLPRIPKADLVLPHFVFQLTSVDNFFSLQKVQVIHFPCWKLKKYRKAGCLGGTVG